jgi:hypothetical protein
MAKLRVISTEEINVHFYYKVSELKIELNLIFAMFHFSQAENLKFESKFIDLMVGLSFTWTL